MNSDPVVKQSMHIEILGRLWLPQCKAALVRDIKIGSGVWETDITPDLAGCENYVYGSETGDLSAIIDYCATLETAVTVWESTSNPVRYTRTITTEEIRGWQSEDNYGDFLDCFPSED